MVTRIGALGVLVVFAAGVWLVAAPFAVGFQPPGAMWNSATEIDEITGGLLTVTGFAGFFGVVAGWAREMYADVRSAASLADRGDPTS